MNVDTVQEDLFFELKSVLNVYVKGKVLRDYRYGFTKLFKFAKICIWLQSLKIACPHSQRQRGKNIFSLGKGDSHFKLLLLGV